jgi:hypothetical protein
MRKNTLMTMKIKFYSNEDQQLFLLEIGKSMNESITERDHGLFIKKRQLLVPQMKSFIRSQDAKSAWNRRRGRYMHGLKRFARSPAGRRLHKKLSRFMLSRGSALARHEAIQAASIVYEQLSYYHPITEQVELEMLWEDLLKLAANEARLPSNPTQCPDCGVWLMSAKSFKNHNCEEQ